MIFEYYSADNKYQKINPDYPRYITEANLVDVSEDEYVDEDSESGEEDDEIYTGDIFEGLNK